MGRGAGGGAREKTPTECNERFPNFLLRLSAQNAGAPCLTEGPSHAGVPALGSAIGWDLMNPPKNAEAGLSECTLHQTGSPWGLPDGPTRRDLPPRRQQCSAYPLQEQAMTRSADTQGKQKSEASAGNWGVLGNGPE